MEEIYQRHSAEYNELVSSEDYKKNLPQYLRSAFEWTNQRVIEAGTGTGRVTEMYIPLVKCAACLDRSEHMLQAARQRLEKYQTKISFSIAENTTLPALPQKCDIFIEGWSFGHSVVAAKDSIENVCRLLLENACKNLHEHASIIIIETLGTNTVGPSPPLSRLGEFYSHLETQYGFSRATLETDYRFESVDEAARIMGFFFGAEMHDLIKSKGQAIIPEWTGIWTRKVNSLKQVLDAQDE
jgi:ubiquinone/menaquinone biosynthesis C-methylase UbiE